MDRHLDPGSNTGNATNVKFPIKLLHALPHSGYTEVAFRVGIADVKSDSVVDHQQDQFLRVVADGDINFTWVSM